MSRINQIRVLGLVTLIGMPLLAWLIAWAFDLKFDLKAWFFPDNFITQVLIGVTFGIVIGFIASWITNRKFMEKVRAKYAKYFLGLNFTWLDVFFISISAGIGEEILFRFALQSLTGIWIAAIIFVGIHGYLNYKDWRLSIYGSFMVIVSGGFGILTIKFGLLSAIISHTVIDIYLLSQVKIEDARLDVLYKTGQIEELENDSD